MTATTSGAQRGAPSWATPERPHGPQHQAGVPGVSRALGVLSLAVGAWQLLAPDDAAQRTGLRGARTSVPGLDDGLPGAPEAVLRAVGVRELAVVPGLLGARSPGWLWARVAGDAVDLWLLQRALGTAHGRRRSRLVASTGAVAMVTAVDVLAARAASRRARPLHLTATVTVLAEPERVYDFWRDLTNLPRFMAHLREVRVDGRRSTWTAEAPVGKVSWEAEITDDVPGQRLAWRSVGRTSVPNEGEVVFTRAPGDRGTEVRVHLDYAVPAGRAGALAARLLGEEPHQQVEDDLRRFKQVIETGDVVVSDGTPEGTRARRHLFQSTGHPNR